MLRMLDGFMYIFVETLAEVVGVDLKARLIAFYPSSQQSNQHQCTFLFPCGLKDKKIS